MESVVEPVSVDDASEGLDSRSSFFIPDYFTDLNNGISKDSDDKNLENSKSPPYHVLMLDCSNEPIDANSIVHKQKLRILDRRFKNDYLSVRLRAFQEAKLYQPHPGKSKSETTCLFTDDSSLEKCWSGASSVERSLAACCTIHPDDVFASVICNLEGGTSTKNGGSSRRQVYSNENDEASVAGALALGKIEKFIGILAMHCHDIGSRALALAILDQTQEQDEIELKERCTYVVTPPAKIIVSESLRTSTSSSVVKPENSNIQPRQNNSKEEVKMIGVSCSTHEDSEFDATNAKSAQAVPFQTASTVAESTDSYLDQYRVSHKKPRRLSQFLHGGGLKILSQWLVDAARPVIETAQVKGHSLKSQAKRRGSDTSVDISTAGNSIKKIVKASETGPILLPLLLFLQKLPFDRHAITQSKINKEIRRLSKQINARVDHQKKLFLHCDDDMMITMKDINLKPFRDPIAGGLDVLEVQSALRELMELWENQAKQAREESTQKKQNSSIVESPFELILQRVRRRLDDVRAYEASSQQVCDESEKSVKENAPEWLEKILRKGKGSVSTVSTSTKAKVSNTTELARRERENERAAMMKQDLEKAQEERRKLLRKLRQFHQQHFSGSSVPSSETGTEPSNDTIRNVGTKNKRHIRWKDGHASNSKARSRSLLEEVFLFHRDAIVHTEQSTFDADDAKSNSDVVAATDADNGSDMTSSVATPGTCNTDSDFDYEDDMDEMEELFG